MDAQMAQNAARLWLQTDAAFGVREVPLVLPKRGPAMVKSVSVTTTTQRPAFHTAPRASNTSPAAAARPQPPAPRSIIPPPVSAEVKEPRLSRRSVDIAGNATLPPVPAGRLDQMPAISAEDKPRLLAELEQQAIAALSPYLSAVATKVVFGDGDPAAALMFVGEGPGAEEDKTGKPFVGRSGQLLDKMISAMGLNRRKVYIGNVVKLRAAEPDPVTGRLRDRPPTPSEVALNISWLHRQIEIIRPRVLVTLGVPALRHLTGLTEGISRVRGTWLEYRGIPLMPTYHPSFVLRSYTPENRAKVWSDLQQVMAKLDLTLP
jgi:DNA polymerase